MSITRFNTLDIFHIQIKRRVTFHECADNGINFSGNTKVYALGEPEENVTEIESIMKTTPGITGPVREGQPGENPSLNAC